jgi:hypothetical protein
MVDELLAGARKQAGRSLAPVRAAAWMRIARVETKRNAGQARITFEMALEEIRRLARPERATGSQENRPVGVANAGTYGTLFRLRVDPRHVTSNGQRPYVTGVVKCRLTLRGICRTKHSYFLKIR